MRLYYSTVGKPLYNCETPYELIECILHAIIGHFNVLRKSNTLHREYLPTRCRGSLIDGDLVKRISDRKAPEGFYALSVDIESTAKELIERDPVDLLSPFPSMIKPLSSCLALFPPNCTASFSLGNPLITQHHSISIRGHPTPLVHGEAWRRFLEVPSAI
ncbi:hypothetical protein BS47DRAFT_364425 [Hydnum rufescens UP504]|uniref:Fungal-type protein kinase domain-containing protein n=1 Tax=Hydnum rufescens UP504 TaxID=1448309 RepID=A0A9P6DLH2_9AGAM|nr:hypothetical protein BS47DRAFT_364425 [Hydnum rufescens UP504]